jgi:hypothetical protein
MIRSGLAWLGYRSTSDELAFLRSMAVIVIFMAFFVAFGVGFAAASEKAPRLTCIAMLLVVSLLVAAEVRIVRRRRRAPRPTWLDQARWYYSEIGEEESGDPVRVFDASGREEVSGESPGRLFLRLEPRSRSSAWVRVLDAAGSEQGAIRSEGLLPGVRFVMRRNGELVWKMSVRSIVRRRHAVEIANGDSWIFETPFFWWQGLTGVAAGAPRLVGGLVWEARSHGLWAMWVEPGRDTFDLLAAVAFMHRQYVRW